MIPIILLRADSAYFSRRPQFSQLKPEMQVITWNPVTTSMTGIEVLIGEP